MSSQLYNPCPGRTVLVITLEDIATGKIGSRGSPGRSLQDVTNLEPLGFLDDNEGVYSPFGDNLEIVSATVGGQSRGVFLDSLGIPFGRATRTGTPVSEILDQMVEIPVDGDIQIGSGNREFIHCFLRFVQSMDTLYRDRPLSQPLNCNKVLRDAMPLA